MPREKQNQSEPDALRKKECSVHLALKNSFLGITFYEIYYQAILHFLLLFCVMLLQAKHHLSKMNLVIIFELRKYSIYQSPTNINYSYNQAYVVLCYCCMIYGPLVGALTN